jgi:nucleolar protein 9
VGEVEGGIRAVPGSFNMAVKKIIEDSTSEIDATSLRVLATHPIGNPTLQLLLELDLALNKADQVAESARPTLLLQLLPGAPHSFSEDTSEATQFINSLVYDQIGARLVETILTHAPGKIFKAINQNIFLPRIASYVRNDVSCYAAIRVLNRLGKEDLTTAVNQIVPTVPQLVAKGRLNVLKTLFERCSVRGLQDEIKALMKGLREGCGSAPQALVTTLCSLDDEEKQKDKKNVQELSRNEYAIRSHGAQLLTTLLGISGPNKGVQESLLALSPEKLLRLATLSMPTVTLLTTALATPSTNPAFHKGVVGMLSPHIRELATSQFGHNFLVSVVEVPSKGKERSIPFHMKEAIMAKLGENETELRDSWMGRSVWRSWKGDMWKTRRSDWKVWMREVDAEVEKGAPPPWQRGRAGKAEEKKTEEKKVEEPAVEEKEEPEPKEEAKEEAKEDEVKDESDKKKKKKKKRSKEQDAEE